MGRYQARGQLAAMGTTYFSATENDEPVFGTVPEFDEYARLGSTCGFGCVGHHFFAGCSAPGDRSARRSIRDICVAVLRDSLGMLYTAEGKNEDTEEQG